nr:hypothetical protein [Tanacetum cinerariifolium]
MDQNIDFSGSDQIQTPQYPEIHPSSQEISDEVFQANHSVQYKEYLENSSKEIVASNSNQEKKGPPQDSDIHYALNSKLLSINSQRLDKKKQEVKNVVEQPAESGNRIIESLQNFRVIHKSSTSLKNTSQISLVHAIAPILSTKKPEQSFSMGYEHFSTTLVTELDEVAESSIKNLVSIPRECDVTSNNEIESKEPVKDDSLVFTTFLNPLFNDSDDFTSNDKESIHDVPTEESKVFSNPLFDNDEIDSDELESHVESNFVESLSNHDALIDSSQKIDYLEEFSGELAHIDPEITESDCDFEEEIRLIENLLYDNSSSEPPKEHNAEEERIKREHAEYISRMEMEEIDIVTSTDDVLPPGVKNDDDSDGEIDAVEELHVDNSISNFANELSDNEASDFDNPSVPRPPSEPPDDKFDFGPDSKKEISVVMNGSNEFEYLDPRDEFNDDNYSSFT